MCFPAQNFISFCRPWLVLTCKAALMCDCVSVEDVFHLILEILNIEKKIINSALFVKSLIFLHYFFRNCTLQYLSGDARAVHRTSTGGCTGGCTGVRRRIPCTVGCTGVRARVPDITDLLEDDYYDYYDDYDGSALLARIKNAVR